MVPRSSGNRRLCSIRVLSASERSIQTSVPEHHSCLVNWRGGLNAVPSTTRLTTSPPARFPVDDGSQRRLSKLLLKVNIDRSLGPVHVVMPAENTVNDLIKAAVEIYVKEKRRPLLEETNPKFFQLHYSQFSLESLEPEEKLINLGSRNFFLYLKPSSSVTSCGSEEAKIACQSMSPLTKFMEFLL
ncbi:PREDICTED: uncharacterized protein At4g22758 [Theobroma cacao]|uniref:Uncharacterized protein At4g22758 n=1 Tax=Theobroma cacao TaxID=3641 RepID=A0AB32W7R1_THECC|nr:PREDICTED: uncharacterized protein At4g22758 [Theobroma cacao]